MCCEKSQHIFLCLGVGAVRVPPARTPLVGVHQPTTVAVTPQLWVTSIHVSPAHHRCGMWGCNHVGWSGGGRCVVAHCSTEVWLG